MRSKTLTGVAIVGAVGFFGPMLVWDWAIAAGYETALRYVSAIGGICAGSCVVLSDMQRRGWIHI